MVADAFLVVLLSLPVVLMGFLVGVRFEAGPMGVLAFIGLGTLWGLMFAGFPYAIGLRTGNPSAVNLSFMLFFPFAFLTTSFVPQENLTGWLGTIADYNPVTYLLEGAAVPPARGWVWRDLTLALVATMGVGVVAQTLALAALRGGRVRVTMRP